MDAIFIALLISLLLITCILVFIARKFFAQTQDQTLKGLDDEHSYILAQQDIVNEIASNQVIGFSMKKLGEMRAAIAEYEKKGAVSKVWSKLGFTKGAREEQARINEYRKITKQVDDYVNEVMVRQAEGGKLREQQQHAAEQATVDAAAREATVAVRQREGIITPEQAPIETIQAQIKEEFGVAIEADGVLPTGPRNRNRAFGLEFYTGSDADQEQRSQKFRQLWDRLISEGQNTPGEAQALARTQKREAIGKWARRIWTGLSLSAGMVAMEAMINPSVDAKTLDPDSIARTYQPDDERFVDFQVTPEMSQHEFKPMKLTGRKPVVGGEAFAPDLGTPVASQKAPNGSEGAASANEHVNTATGEPVAPVSSRDVYKLKDGRTVVVLDRKDKRGQEKRDYIFRRASGPFLFERLVSTDEKGRVTSAIDVFNGELHTRDKVWYKIHKFNEITQQWEVKEKHPIPQSERNKVMGDVTGKKLEGEERDVVLQGIIEGTQTP